MAEKLGIDLIWFGVLLAVNMQTSFMHPPFGFALFFLRSVAPKDDYDDKVTRRRIKGIKTTDIYWGAIPFVCIQIIMVGLVIAFPSLVEGGLGSRTKVDVNTIHLEIDAPAYGAPESSDTPSEEGAAEDAPEDPMEALKRQLQEQK